MNQEPKIYLTRAGRSGEDEERVFENNVAIVGFQEVPSLATATDYENVHEIVTGAFHDAKARAVGNFAGQLWAFAVAMKEGDLVVLPRKLTSQIAIGRVTGPYEYRQVDDAFRHTRPVEWLQMDLPRTVFEQDLLYSLGASMTVCNISRNDAERRVASVAEGKPDPGPSVALDTQSMQVPGLREHSEGLPDLAQLAHDQIVAHIQAKFSGHALAILVNAVLRAEGWLTKPSPPGADGGVDILAGRGSLGLDEPRLCVQVKSQNSPADVTIYRTLQGAMQTFNAQRCRRSMHNRDCWSAGEASTRWSLRKRGLGTSASASGTVATWSRPSIAPTSDYPRRSRPSYPSSEGGCLSSRSRRTEPRS